MRAYWVVAALAIAFSGTFLDRVIPTPQADAAVHRSVGIAAEPSTPATTLQPVSLTIEAGAAVGNVQSLQSIDGSVLHLGPNASRSYRSYQLPGSIGAANIWSFTVNAHYSGPLKTQQLWKWFIRDFTTAKWVLLGDNIEVVAQDVATPLRFYPAGPFAKYVSPTGALQLRSVGAAKPFTLDLDAESIDVDAGTRPTFGGWKPSVGTRWQYQLQPPVDATVAAVPWTGGAAVAPDVFDIDMYEADGVTPAAPSVTAIHALGHRAICYVDAGTYENWRPDIAAFPSVVLGGSNGWPGEKWLDIRRLDVLVPIISARVQKCFNAGFDAVEFDNMDAAFNRSGFKLSKAQQIEFDRAMADVAHFYGLAVGLKNDVAQLTQLEPWFDFAINEQCSQYSECGGYDDWTSRGKAVAQVEYTASLASFCPSAIAAGRSGILKSLALLARPYTPCN